MMKHPVSHDMPKELEQILLNSINRSMQASALQVRCSSGRTSYATTREQALKQVQMLQQAKQAQQTGK